MRNFIKAIALFFPFAILVYLLLIFAWGWSSNYFSGFLQPNLQNHRGFSSFTFNDLNTTENVDLLFLGSSHCYRGFDNRRFEKAGYKVFNLGTSSQTPLHSLALIREYINTLRPKTIIYEVYPLTFSNTINKAEPSLEIIVNDRLKPYMLNMLFLEHNIIVYNSFFYKVINALLPFEMIKPAVRRYNEDTYIGNGYIERDLAFYKYQKHLNLHWNIDKEQVKAFEEILLIAKSKGIKVMLVYAPITSGLYQAGTNNNNFDTMMAAHGDFYNFNKILSLDDSLHFYDDNHLNKNGVAIFNDTLIAMLKAQIHH